MRNMQGRLDDRRSGKGRLGVAYEKHLTESDLLEAEVKLHDASCTEACACGDGMKFERRGLHSISHVSEFVRVPAADGTSARLEILVEERV
jgi:hypothetical protein